MKTVLEFSKEISTSEGPAYISASIGYASMPADAIAFDELIKLADKGMYLAKKSGKGKVCNLHEMINARLSRDSEGHGSSNRVT